MGMAVAGIIINTYYGSFPHSLLSTSKFRIILPFSKIACLQSHDCAGVAGTPGPSALQTVPSHELQSKIHYTKLQSESFRVTKFQCVFEKRGLLEWM